MRCAICKKDNDEVKLFDGVFEKDMVMVCESCASLEGIPLIKKPSVQQINSSKGEALSVRQRMERLSGAGKTTPISLDQSHVQGNLARLKVLPKKQNHPDVLENYYWTVKFERRRMKLSQNQMAERTGVSLEDIQDIENGILPEDFEETLLKLEDFLGKPLLRVHKPKITFERKVEEEQQILDIVKRRMSGEEVDIPQDNLSAKNKIQKEKIENGEFDFSDRKALENLTLNDLAEIKRRREKQEKIRKEQQKRDEMIGDEVEVEE